MLKIAGMIAKIFISPSPEIIRIEFDKILKERGVSLNHPDLLCFAAGEKVGIEQARKIKQYLSTKPYQSRGKVIIIEDGSVMTAEAQNALLKTLEELPTETIILIGTDSEANLLPTVLSRCQTVRLTAPSKSELFNEYTQDILKMLAWDKAKRFGYIEKLKERELFLDTLVKTFHNLLYQREGKDITHQLTEEEIIKFIQKLIEAQRWSKQNVNIRAILEYLMLEMPNLQNPEKNS
ncbi:hypothetical protein HY386_00255 [Candidatus Daviesbacteria bacterium]|nr:hypothetical protein [Candidatus Daviesbacteria bacterium]